MGDDNGSVTPYGQYRLMANLRGDEENQERGLTALNANRKESHIPEVMGLRFAWTPLGVDPAPPLTFVVDGYVGAFGGPMLPYGFDHKTPNEQFAMNLNEASVAVQSDGFHAKAGWMPTMFSAELPFLNGYGANLGDIWLTFITNSLLFNAVPFYHLGGNLGYGGEHVDTTFHVYMGSDKVRPKTNVPSFVWSLVTKPVPEFNFTSHLMAGPEGEENDHWRFTLDLLACYKPTPDWSLVLEYLHKMEKVEHDYVTVQGAALYVNYSPKDGWGHVTLRQEVFANESGNTYYEVTLGAGVDVGRAAKVAALEGLQVKGEYRHDELSGIHQDTLGVQLVYNRSFNF